MPQMERGRAHLEEFAAAESQEEPEYARSDASGDTLWQVSYDRMNFSPVQSSPRLSDADGDSDEDLEIVPDEQCTFCSLLEYCDHELDTDTDGEAYTAECRHAFFHEECSSCSTDDIPLCDFCQHLRLQHLLMCLPQDIPCLWFEIRLPPPMDFLNRKECRLCRFLSNAISLPLPESVWMADMLSATWSLYFTRETPRSNNASWSLVASLCRNEITTVDRISIRQKSLGSSCREYDEVANEFHEFVRWDIARDWVSNCHANHEECGISRRPSLPPEFCVIDVHSRRLVKIRDCEFVALSYVWGSRPEEPSYVVETTRDNIGTLLSTGFGELPKTIEDAITVCKQLGKQYLWADRYCIVQDDSENKHSQINAMDDIYTASSLTIIACSGSSVESGLQGVGERRQGKQERFHINGLELTHALPNIEPLVVKSIWNTRAWTYQEAVLARRKLYLTPAGVLLECRRERRGEHTVSDSDWSYLDMSLLPREDSTTNALFEGYCRHVKTYTSRHLSYDTDIYNAFEGIARALYRDKCSFYYGIPESQFDQALLWICDGFKPDDSNNRYTRSCAQKTPSWSWGSVRWPVGFMEPEYFSMALVKWTMYTNGRFGVRPKTIKATDEPHRWREWQNYRQSDGKRDGSCPQLFLALAAREGCFENEIPCSIPTKDSFPSLRKRTTRRWPKYTDAYSELLENSPREGPRVDGVLYTRAQSATFYLDSLWIKDAEGCAIGHVYPDPRLHRFQAPAASRNRPVEFIALSLRSHHALHSELLHNNPDLPKTFGFWTLPKAEYRDMTYFDCNDMPLSPVPAVNVMLICWEDGFARRVTVGLIMLKQWAKAERKFKDVWLK